MTRTPIVKTFFDGRGAKRHEVNPIFEGRAGHLHFFAMDDCYSTKSRGRQDMTIGEIYATGRWFQMPTLREAIRTVHVPISEFITRTVGGLSATPTNQKPETSSLLPLSEMPQIGEGRDKGKLYMEGYRDGTSRFILATKDNMAKAIEIMKKRGRVPANASLDTVGPFAVMDKNYAIVDASKDGREYAIRADDMTPEQLARTLRLYYGHFKFINAFTEDRFYDLNSEVSKRLCRGTEVRRTGTSVDFIYFRKPGPAEVGFAYNIDGLVFCVSFGDINNTYTYTKISDGIEAVHSRPLYRFGAATYLPRDGKEQSAGSL